MLEGFTTEAALAVIRSLPRDQAEAVMLRAVMGLDAKSAGAILGKRPGAVRSAAHRGLSHRWHAGSSRGPPRSSTCVTLSCRLALRE